jgi:hypothetical protein
MCMCWCRVGWYDFVLMIGFNGLFDTARDCTLKFTTTHTYIRILVSTITSSLAVAR